MSILSDSPATILQKLLVDEAAAAMPPATPWPCYIGRLPDGSEVEAEILAVFDTEPRQDGRIMATGERIEHPGFQVRVRANAYNTGHLKLSQVAAILDAVKNQAVSGDSATYTVNAITRVGGVIPIGTDENGREGFTLNATATITENP